MTERNDVRVEAIFQDHFYHKLKGYSVVSVCWNSFSFGLTLTFQLILAPSPNTLPTLPLAISFNDIFITCFVIAITQFIIANSYVRVLHVLTDEIHPIHSHPQIR